MPTRPQEAGFRTLLVSGGDERLSLDPRTGLNRYGCGVEPDPGLDAFCSSTASTISPLGYAAAQDLHARLCAAPSEAAACADAAQDLRRRLARLCGLPAASARAIGLSASGTDVHRLAALRERAAGRGPLTIILPEPCETGRGVPQALAGGGEIRTVRLRQDDGRPRAADAVDADVARLCAEAVDGGGRVLLCLLDLSKTGLIAPSAGCASDLKQRFGAALAVLVDGCQFRMSPATLRGWLEAGFMVGVTGSKFLGGPAFSGALIAPDGQVADDEPTEAASHGLLLRWEAAIAELTAFRALVDADIADLVQAFGAAVESRLDASPAFERLPAPGLQRSARGGWDSQPTIVSFLPLRDGRALAAPATQALFAGLEGVRLGQPVSVGHRHGAPVSALRLALGARQITAALTTPGGRERLIAGALTALDRTAEQIGAN